MPTPRFYVGAGPLNSVPHTRATRVLYPNQAISPAPRYKALTPLSLNPMGKVNSEHPVEFSHTADLVRDPQKLLISEVGKMHFNKKEKQSQQNGMTGAVYTKETDFLLILETIRTKIKVLAVLISPEPFSWAYRWPLPECVPTESFLCVHVFLEAG